MKKLTSIKIGSTTLLSLGVVLSISLLSIERHQLLQVSASVISTNGCSYVSKLPKQIDLNPVGEDEIREYYSSLASLNENELKGDNLLKNLKPILYEMNYYSYDNIWKIYEITDRDWEASPANMSDSYDTESNSYTNYTYKSSKYNPYVHALYRDSSIEGGEVKAWGDHNNSGINREHVWCQSRGFSDAGNGATGPAGTDLHHLIAGDGYVNTAIHNNNPYGFVDVTEKIGDKEYNNQNKKGTALHKHSDDVSSVVFEPRDEDKGDIARAIFYMAARYNNLSGHDEITNFEPNLKVANFATDSGDREYSSATKAVTMGILQDLLVWNKIDPVDEYEITRNNLIYKNYQGNRNPFVDFPEWADYIWGTATMDSYDSTPTGYARSNSDKIAAPLLSISRSSITLDKNKTINIKATTKDNSPITWSITSGEELISISKTTSSSGEEITVTSFDSEGSAIVHCAATVNGEAVSRDVYVRVGKPAQEEGGFKLDKKTLIIIGAIAGVVVVVLIIIFASSSKKNKKKLVKTAKKTGKTLTKVITTSGAKKVSTSSKTTKKK